MSIGIYSITHVSGTAYIGQSVNVGSRIKGHQRSLRNGTHHCVYLQRAWNKYGEDQFTFAQILSCSKDDLTHYEDLLFKQIASLFNTHKIAGAGFPAGHGRVSRSQSAETKQKISKATMGRIFTVERNKKVSEASLKRGGTRIWAVNKNGQTMEFISMCEAGRVLAMSNQTVWNCLNGRQAQSKGWRFGFAHPKNLRNDILA